MLRIHGPDVYDQWVSNEMPFDDPRVVEVAEFVGDIWFAEGNVLGGRDLIAATGFKEAALPIASGDCVLHRQANFAGAFFTEIDAELGPDGDVNVFYLPTISDEFGQGAFLSRAFLKSCEGGARFRCRRDKARFGSQSRSYSWLTYQIGSPGQNCWSSPSGFTPPREGA